MAGRKKGGRAVSMTRKSASGAGNIAQQIWLAGLGAMARAQTEGPKLFESLVVEGAVIQERGRKAAEGAVSNVRGAMDSSASALRDRAAGALDNIEKIFQTRVQTALQQMGVPTTHEIEDLSRKVDGLTRSVQDLTRTSAARNVGATARTKRGRAARGKTRGVGARKARAASAGAAGHHAAA